MVGMVGTGAEKTPEEAGGRGIPKVQKERVSQYFFFFSLPHVPNPWKFHCGERSDCIQRGSEMPGGIFLWI